MTGFLPQPLPALFEQIPIPVYSAIPDVLITDISLDSRTIKSGGLFVALSGGSTDGHRFIPQAVERGARVVLGDRADVDCPVSYVRVDEPRRAMAYLAAAYYRFPARQLTVIGVTGTDGKTTTSNLIYQILIAAGIPAGVISTVNATIGAEVVDTGFHVTTPEAPEIQRYLKRMVDAGLTHVVIEATSHGLDQHRVTACEFDIAVVTNITHEHLDYHGSYEAYRAAKARLFQMLAETGPKPGRVQPRLAVLNRDDESYAYLSQLVKTPQVDYGLQPGATVTTCDIEMGSAGTRFEACGPGFRIPVQMRLVGAFNVSNGLAAVAAARAGLGIAPTAIQRGVAALTGVPGRMEAIDLGQPFTAIVDFAHTPNALKRALETARQMTGGRVIAVFGSAGLRDRQKRRMMAETAAQLADFSFFTAEDPRTEDLASILDEMAAGARSRGGVEGQNFALVPDRGAAVRQAVSSARPGDLVIACGKGHEQSMCFGVVEYPWDDRVAMRAALAELMGVPGPAMPYLPTQGERPA